MSPAARLGWAVQWGPVRMLGTLLTNPDQGPVPACNDRSLALFLYRSSPTP